MSPLLSECKRTAGEPTSYTGVIGDPDATVTVECHCSHLASAPRAVFVVSIVPRHRIVVIIVNVGASVLVLQQTGPGVKSHR